MSNSEYSLQVKLPYGGGQGVYVRGSDYWNTVAGGSDLNHLKEQAAIMQDFWKYVRIIQERQVITEQVEIPLA